MRVCIASQEKRAYSRSFISNQVKFLDAEVFYIHGGAMPCLEDEKDLSLSRTSASFIQGKVKQKLKGETDIDFPKENVLNY